MSVSSCTFQRCRDCQQLSYRHWCFTNLPWLIVQNAVIVVFVNMHQRSCQHHKTGGSQLTGAANTAEQIMVQPDDTWMSEHQRVCRYCLQELTHIRDFAVTLILTPRPSKSNHFTCTLSYIINHKFREILSLVKFHQLVCKIPCLLTGLISGRTEAQTHGSTHRWTTQKSNASDTSINRWRHKQ